MNWTLLPYLLGALLLAPAGAGEIEGNVVLRSRPGALARGQRKKRPPRDYESQPGQPVLPLENELQGLVVFLEHLEGGPQKVGTYALKQQGRRFIPHVLPVVQGSTVDFINADRVYHSVYSETECRPFDFPEYPPGVSRKITFPQTGVVEIFCAIHSEMNGYVLVLPGGHFSTVDSQSRFRLSQVPAGSHVLKTWHPRLPAQVRKVEVPARGVLRLDLEL